MEVRPTKLTLLEAVFFNLSWAHKESGQASWIVWVMLIGSAERSEHIWLRGIEDRDKQRDHKRATS